MRTLEEAKYAFKSIAVNEDQNNAITVISSQFEQLLEHIFTEVPAGADRTAAVRKLLEAKFTCIQSITHSCPSVSCTKPGTR